jgi:4-amino-4-deoxychorismate lyase
MSQLIESICLENGLLKNLEYHQDRVNRSFRALIPNVHPLQLKSSIILPDVKGKHKCRLVYDAYSCSYSFVEYQNRLVRTMKIVEVNHIEYTYKYLDRHSLELAFNQRAQCDDIIIIKNGLVTDSTYANLAFFDGSRWFTPKHPLLRGTKRAQLLTDGLVTECDIRKGDIKAFEKISLINAMLDLGDLILSTSQIKD